METALTFLAICTMVSTCLQQTDSLPQECAEAFAQGGRLLEEMQASGKFSTETMTYFRNNRDQIADNISRIRDTPAQRRACEPLKNLMREQLQRIADVEDMRREEIEYHFGTDRMRSSP